MYFLIPRIHGPLEGMGDFRDPTAGYGIGKTEPREYATVVIGRFGVMGMPVGRLMSQGLPPAAVDSFFCPSVEGGAPDGHLPFGMGVE